MSLTPGDRLSSTDEFGDRIFLYPAEVKGRFRNYRNWTQGVLIIFFLALPWLKINGTQAVLLDLAHRRFNLFGITFLAHDGPLIFFVLLTFVVALLLATSIFGRVWCGWACPQTVFIDGVFRKIETLIEGTYLERRKLDSAPLSVQKILLKSSKWSLFVFASLVISHSFLAYFVGVDHLFEMSQSPPRENWATFLVMAFVAGVVLFDFAWFREQFCIIMCPYGRLQSVMMDNKSLAVLYDEKRGEPRKGKTTGQQGDCIACNRCVNVCPTGIDIRNGVQLECIACTACIDACDEIMDKVHKPRGLIRYSSQLAMDGQTVSRFDVRRYIYGAVLLLAVVGISIAVYRRQSFHIEVLRSRDLYTQLSENGEDVVVNHFKVHIHNQSDGLMAIRINLSQNLTDSGVKLSIPEISEIKANEEKTVHFFLRQPKAATKDLGYLEGDLLFYIDESSIPEARRVKILGPF